MVHFRDQILYAYYQCTGGCDCSYVPWCMVLVIGPSQMRLQLSPQKYRAVSESIALTKDTGVSPARFPCQQDYSQTMAEKN